VDVRQVKEDLSKIKITERSLDSLERQIQELYRVISTKELSPAKPQPLSDDL
jgi:uncharacterized coiled-coil DUF342 family protein